MSEFNPNPERYKIASEPHESADAAEAALDAFFTALGELREKHHVPEVVIVAAAYHGDRMPVAKSAAFGDSRLHPELAAAAHRLYVQPILDHAESLRESAAKTRRKK